MSKIMEKTLASLPKLLTQSLIGGKTVKNPRQQPPSPDVQNFMKAVHRARSKNHEAAIVRAELLVLQRKLKEKDSIASTAVIRNSFTKAIFCHLLGYDVTFVAFYAMNLAQMERGYDKRLGYLVCCLLLHPKHELVMMMTSSLLRDLKSPNMGDNCTALLVVSQLADEETIPYFLPEVLVKFKHSHELVREKALHCFRSLYQSAPALLQPSLPQLNVFLASRDPGVLTAVVNTFVILTEEKPSKFTGLGNSFLHILNQINNRGFGSNYYYHMVPLPWLQISLLKILGYLGAVDSELSQFVSPILEILIEKTKVTEPVSLAILGESVLTATKINAPEKLLHLCSSCIGKLLSSDASNTMRYLGLGLLISLSRVKSSYAAQHQKAVVECLVDEDPAIQVRTTQLLHAMANNANMKAICSKLFEQIRNSSDQAFVTDVLQMISNLGERFSTEMDWYLDTYLSILNFDLNTQLREKFIELALSKIEQFMRNSQTISEDSLDNLIARLLSVVDSPDLTHPTVILSVYLFGILAPAIGNNLPTSGFLSAATKLFSGKNVAESASKKLMMIKPPLPHDQKFDSTISSDSEQIVKTQCSLIDAVMKLVLSGGLKPSAVKDWLQKNNIKQSVKGPAIHSCLEELEELVHHPENLPLRSQIMFHPEAVGIDLSLSFLDPQVVQHLLQGGEIMKPKYMKAADQTAESSLQSDSTLPKDSSVYSNLSQSLGMKGSKDLSSDVSKMSKSVIKTKNKWRDDDYDYGDIEPGEKEDFCFVGGENDGDGILEEEKKRKEAMARELFAGLDGSGDTEMSGMSDFQIGRSVTVKHKKKTRNIWDDDDEEENHSISGPLGLHPFGMSRKAKNQQQSQWYDEDIENDNLSFSTGDNTINTNSELGFISSKSEKAESPSLSSPLLDISRSDMSGSLSFNSALSPVDSVSHTMPSIYAAENFDLELSSSGTDTNVLTSSVGAMSVSTVDALTDSDPEDVNG